MKPTQLPLVETMNEEDFDFADSAFFSPEELKEMNKPIEKSKSMGELYPFIPFGTPEGAELAQLHSKIINATGDFFTEVGLYFKQAQNLMANHRNGNFQAFIESCGYTKQTVHNLIGRYNLIVQNLDNKQLIEQLPLSVTYEIASPSADPELKEKVLSGEITSRKEMEAWKEEKKKILAEKEQIMRQRDEYAQAKVKLEQQLAKKPNEVIRETIKFDEEAVDRARAEEREKAEKEYSIKLKEERKRIEEQLASEIRHHENNIANLENELAILRPLKKREAEIIEKQKQIDEAREEVYRAKMRNNLFDAVTKARRMFNDAIYPVVTVTMTPEIIGDTLKAELQQLMKMTEDFAFAMKQKFNL